MAMSLDFGQKTLSASNHDGAIVEDGVTEADHASSGVGEEVGADDQTADVRSA
jgi:hypothetical protein